MKLASLLIEQPMMAKLAVVETPNGQQLEQDFGKLAYAFLKDRAPKLLPSMIGFEIVESNPDGSRAVGIFGFKIGTGIYYVPVFFLNNQIKGMVEIYSRDTDSYVPLRESWVNHIVTRQSLDLGEPGDAKVRESFSVPDFGIMASPPQLGAGGRDSGAIKASSAKELMADLKQHFIKVAGNTIKMLENDPEMKAMLAGALGAVKGASFNKTAASNSMLISFIKTAGGPIYAKALAKMLQDPVFAKSASAFYDYKDLLINEFDEKFRPVKKAEKVTVISKGDDCCPAQAIADSDKQKLVRQGFVINDKREKDEKAEAFDFVSEDRISNPTEPGTYHVIMTAGINTCNVVTPNVPSFGDRMMLVFDDKGNYFTAHGRRVFVNGDKVTPEEKQSCFDKGSAPDSMAIGKTYILINENMKSSMPFTVRSIVEGGDAKRYIIDYSDNIQHSLNRDDAGALPSNYDYNGGFPNTCGINLYLSPSEGQLRATQDSLLVPEKSWKAIELNRPDGYSERKAMERAFAPATYSEVMEDMFKNDIHDVKVDSKDEGQGFDIAVDDVMDKSGMTYKSACIRLVKDYGLSVEDAEIMLKEASTNYKSRRLVKFAQIPMQVVPPAMPPTNQGGFDQTLGIPVQNPQVSYTQGDTVVPPPRPSGPGSGVNIGGEAARQQAGGNIGSSNTSSGQASPTDGMDVNQMAQMAAESGQQQVFDQTAIGGMARVYDTNNMIDGFIPEFMKSLDKLGRLIFMYYWKNEDFAERFGAEDMPALEDSLGSVFKNFGDLILKLKQKTVTNEDRFYI